MNKFSTGNKETLKGSVPELIKFHEKYYSANLMSLVVRSSQNIEDFIRESDFTLIPDTNAKKPNYKKYGYPLQKTGMIAKYRIDQSARKISYVYQVDSPYKSWET